MTDRTGASELRRSLVDAVRRLDALGLNVNSSGNLSVRAGDDILVTPSGIAAERLTPDQIVALDAAGAPTMAGQLEPTSERLLHTALYAGRPDVGAVVHTHSPEATAASTLGEPLAAIHYVVARFGGVGARGSELGCAGYATYGSAELAESVASTLGSDRHACLMANHGAIAVAPDLERAIALALDVEWFCGVYRRAASLGSPVVLDDAEMQRVAQRFGTYGQAEQPPSETTA